jgi:hypothetical protein
MPRKAIDYSNTVIYKIVCNDLNITDCYVGHTTDFTKRKYTHKYNAVSNRYNYKLYQFINENGGWNNWQMIMVEKIECADSMEATARERYWFETLGATLNGNVPNRCQQEYREKNLEQILQKKKEYREQNREKILQKVKEYYDTNREKINEKHICQCGGCYTYAHKATHEKTKKHQKAMENLETNATV